jgi:lipopolysaccharide transport system ATP-binding protein
MNQVIENAREGDVFEFRARFPMNLGVGTYSFSVALSSTETHLVNNYEWRDLALVFSVANTQRTTFVGMAWIPPRITISIPRKASPVDEGDTILANHAGIPNHRT